MGDPVVRSMRLELGVNDRVSTFFSFLFLGLMEGTVTAKVLSSLKRREKEDRIGESQPFRERAGIKPVTALGYKVDVLLSKAGEQKIYFR
jgi:hypothetical protein